MQKELGLLINLQLKNKLIVGIVAVSCVSIEHCCLQSTLHLSFMRPYMLAGGWIGWTPMVSLDL